MTARISPLYRWQYLLLLLSLVLLWPAIVNGGVFYFPDTTAYIRGVDAALHRATNWQSVWTESVAAQGTTVESRALRAAIDVPGSAETKPVLLGRSVYYGVMPFAGVAFGSSGWLTIVVQSLVAGAAAIGLTRHFIDPRRHAFGWACAAGFALLAVTSLPFFTSMLMPDFIAGIGIIAAAALVVGWQRESWGGRGFWFVLVLAATLMHSANILILLAIAGPALLFAGFRRDGGVARGGALIVVGVLLGLAGEAAFTQTVTRLTGAAPIRPPFVTARLIEDGPGLAYLDRTCPASGFLLCRFRDRMPQGSDTFLWSPASTDGVFTATSPANQRALSAEQGRFVLAVVTTFPRDSAVTMLRAAGRQMGLLSLVEFNYPPHGHLERVPAAVMDEIVTTRAYARTMPLDPSQGLLWPLAIAAIVVVGFAFRRPTMRPVAGYGAVAVVGLLANDIVCGALSTPHERYQARIIWVLPFVALLILIHSRYARSNPLAAFPHVRR